MKPVEGSGTAPPKGCRVQGYNRGEEELMAVHLHAFWYKARIILQKSTTTTSNAGDGGGGLNGKSSNSAKGDPL